METNDLAELLSELVEAAAAGALAADDAHVIGNTLVFRHPGHDMTVRSARRRAIAVVDGEPLELDRVRARRIAAVFPKAVAMTCARRARVAERSVHVRVAPNAPAAIHDDNSSVDGLGSPGPVPPDVVPQER